jgi:hypothetical protein
MGSGAQMIFSVIPGLVPGTYPFTRPNAVEALGRVVPRIKSAGDDLDLA